MRATEHPLMWAHMRRKVLCSPMASPRGRRPTSVQLGQAYSATYGLSPELRYELASP
eukprot:CAMPEP_0174750176 /NCGR_PEP_ID=MMETSP1094-20130205/97213_1 /TAXON_ID=156173 /ORGANISM="Chrysochromulina brevifilum, Strain UTEX LB 985" /LENGTH=56 /DNA_ID=CAMNT_0015955489 /DNA_START=175 /DNA_END=341 /DNA_ORIENTATION=+